MGVLEGGLHQGDERMKPMTGQDAGRRKYTQRPKPKYTQHHEACRLRMEETPPCNCYDPRVHGNPAGTRFWEFYPLGRIPWRKEQRGER